MRRPRPDSLPPLRLPPPRECWLPHGNTPVIGIDPATWSQRTQQIALWTLIEHWNRGKRLH